MASFYAELHLQGQTYRVWHCHYSTQQAVDARGRVSAKVRHGPLHLLVDIPENDQLLSWATTPHKPLAGEVVFYDVVAQVPHETIAFATGECVSYFEEFESGDAGQGAYRARLIITSPTFELKAGGPTAPLAAIESVQGGLPTVDAIPAAVIAAAAQVPAPPFVPEYSLSEFAATIKGAEHVVPQAIIQQLYQLFNEASDSSLPGMPAIAEWKKLENLMRRTYYVDPADNITKPLNGHWPPANGGYKHQVVQLKAGDVFDRFQGGVFDKKIDPADSTKKLDLEVGDEFDVTFGGEFASPMGKAGTPKVAQSFGSRALDRAESKYPFAYEIEIIDDVPEDLVVGELAQVIPWYGQPGGGTQMRISFLDKGWKYQEWKKMQNEKYARLTLKSSPSGEFEILPGNRAKKIT